MYFEAEAVILGTAIAIAYRLGAWLMTPARRARTLRALHHISEMGKREIASSYPACLRNLAAAGGAGLVTVLTLALKLLIVHASLTWLGVSMLGSVNFIASFLLIQAIGFRLATKQSPLLGAALGARMGEIRSSFNWRRGKARLREEIGWIVRTQFFSAVGNLGVAVAAAFAFSALFLKLSGKPFMDAHGARAALESLHPWKSNTIAYAAATGGILWFCTLLGGVVASSFGKFSKTVATTSFNVCLGFVLAVLPVAGKTLSLPIDVRHFTLSSGTAAMAVASMGFSGAVEAGLIPAASSILVIGAMNFGVSFALAFLASWLTRASGSRDTFAAPGSYLSA